MILVYVALAACLSAVVSMCLLLAVVKFLHGRGAGIVDAMARRRWGHTGRECEKESEG